MSEMKKDIRALSLAEIEAQLTEMGEAKFRGKQIYEWLWKHQAKDFDSMSNLSKSLREKLKEHFQILAVERSNFQHSNDGTIKNAFKLHDGHLVEGVLIPTDSRSTACISSQVGCSLTCAFCATGRLKRLRNITAAEIFDQVALINEQSNEHLGRDLSNIVYMGMGEPLLNYREVLRSTELICSDEGLGWSAKRITVSTAGIAKMIKQLGDDMVKFNLALSLHAANDEKRSKIMPINDQNNLAALTEALEYYHAKTGNRVTYEYIIFNNFNDEIEDARELANFCMKVPSKVNIIEYNPIDGGEFEQADPTKTDAFKDYLESRGVNTHIRRSRGKDIDAACGQLANKLKA